MEIKPRPIKFKVWDTKLKRFRTDLTLIDDWLDADSWDDPEELFTDPYHWLTAPTFNGRMIWCQYTGINDEYGAEIYEGDILRVILNGQIAYVEFIDGCFMLTRALFPLEHGFLVGDGMEIIGNVFENEDLIKTGDA